MSDATVNVRYMVHDVETAVAWYTTISVLRCFQVPPRRLPTSGADPCDCC